VFATVAREASNLLGEPVTLVRIDSGGVLVPMAAAGDVTDEQLEALAERVTRTGRGARTEHVSATGESVSAAAAPIAISGEIWGLLVASSSEHALGPGSEERITQFAELIAVSIANAEGRAALSASRARVLASADEARRRLQRDLHDGAQQALVQTVWTLKLADEALREGTDSAGGLVADALEQAQRAAADLSGIARGLLPAALRHGGLQAAIRTLVADTRLEVDVEITPLRFGIDIETTAYFIAAEALTNVVKHAHADRVSVAIRVEDEQLVVEVVDDGVGGVDSALGSGVTGLFDRAEAANGTLSVRSAPGAGTTIRAALPCRPGSA
jgi:signal transduction histidine kinase